MQLVEPFFMSFFWTKWLQFMLCDNNVCVPCVYYLFQILVSTPASAVKCANVTTYKIHSNPPYRPIYPHHFMMHIINLFLPISYIWAWMFVWCSEVWQWSEQEGWVDIFFSHEIGLTFFKTNFVLTILTDAPHFTLTYLIRDWLNMNYDQCSWQHNEKLLKNDFSNCRPNFVHSIIPCRIWKNGSDVSVRSELKHRS